jgi:uncharacterized protein YecE (DUF72 family)
VTFYRMPSSKTFRAWAARVPDGFVFAVKASRYLTHIRRLREPKEPVAFLMERAGELGSHLGPVLLQLPPDMPVDLDRLAATLDAFPPSVRVAFEPRHTSWFTEGLRALLTEHGVALCLADRRGPLMPPWRTADWGYLRFHAGRARPASCYGEQALSTWASATREQYGSDSTVYGYFNNDHAGCALRDAAVFGRLLSDEGVEVARQPEVADDVLHLPARSA